MSLKQRKGWLFRLPNGNALSPASIEAVEFHAGRGVMIKGANSAPLAWIPSEDDTAGQIIRDEVIATYEAAEKGRKYQPDWSVLDQVTTLRPQKVG